MDFIIMDDFENYPTLMDLVNHLYSKFSNKKLMCDILFFSVGQFGHGGFHG